MDGHAQKNGHHHSDKEERMEAEHDEKVEELRRALGPLTGRAAIFCSDECLRRYLRARHWNVHKAEKMLRDTLAWRNQYRPEEIQWDDISVEAETGKVYRTTYNDTLGRRVLIMKVANQNTTDQVNQVRQLVYCLENAILLQQPGQEKMAWLIDFRGWSMKKSPPLRQSVEVLNILQNHYPERLGAALCYDPPHVFGAFWKLIRPFLDPVTYQKIQFLYANTPETKQVLHELIGEEQLEKDFGGKSDFEYNFEEYGKMMKEDDKKTAEFWQIGERGLKDVGWLPTKAAETASHGWGRFLRHGHGHGHVHAHTHGQEQRPAPHAEHSAEQEVEKQSEGLPQAQAVGKQEAERGAVLAEAA